MYGLNTIDGELVYKAIADAQGLLYIRVEDVINRLMGDTND